jgi:hypothetical protein
MERRNVTLTTGVQPALASHNTRQESSPTLQNSCALLKEIDKMRANHKE